MTFEQLKEIIVETLGCDQALVTLEARLSEDIGADSLDSVELNMAIEEACGASVPDEALAEIQTVRDLLEQVKKHSA